MSQATLLAVLMAVAIGLSYGGSMFAVLRRALKAEGQRSMNIFLGGILVRMMGLLLAVGLVVALMDINAMVFLGVLIPFIIVFIVLEVMSLMKHARTN